MAFLWTGFAVLVPLGIVCAWRIRADYRSGVRLSNGTAILVCLLYTLNAVLTFWAAWDSIWLIPLNKYASVAIGTAVTGFGLYLFSFGILQFRSFARMLGVKTDKLITTGVYRWSRNPQNVGWGLVLTGGTLIGRSGLALLSTLIFWIAFRLYLGTEEKLLETIYKNEWREYIRKTSWFLGKPKA